MKISLHAGLPCTEGDRLAKAFLRNSELLRSHGVCVPGPGRYRGLLTEIFSRLRGAPPSDGAREVFLDAALEDDMPAMDRMVLTHDRLFGAPVHMFAGGTLLPETEQRLAVLRGLFATDRLELFIALRNPVTLLPAMLAETPHDSVGALLQGMDVRNLRWFPLIERIRAAAPDVPITVWAYEDLPLIWGEVVRRVCGLPSGTKITGAFDLLSEIMQPEGMRRFRAYLAERPTLKEAQKRKAMMAFLGKYAREDAIEEDLEVPGWDADFVETLTEIYEADVDFIATMDGVKVLEV